MTLRKVSIILARESRNTNKYWNNYIIIKNNYKLQKRYYWNNWNKWSIIISTDANSDVNLEFGCQLGCEQLGCRFEIIQWEIKNGKNDCNTRSEYE